MMGEWTNLVLLTGVALLAAALTYFAVTRRQRAEDIRAALEEESQSNGPGGAADQEFRVQSLRDLTDIPEARRVLIEEISAEAQRINRKLSIASEAIREDMDVLQKLNRRVAELEAQSVIQDGRERELQRSLQERQGEIRQLHEKSSQLTDRLESAESTLEATRRQLETTSNALAEMERAYHAAIDKSAEVRDELTFANEALTEARERVSSIENMMSRKDAEIAVALQANSELKAELASFQNQVEILESKVERAVQRAEETRVAQSQIADRARREKSAVEARLASAVDAHEAAKTKLAESERARERSAGQINHLRSELGQLRNDSGARIRELESLVNEQKAQISVLERMVDQLRLKPNVRAVRNTPAAEPEEQKKLLVIPGNKDIDTAG